MKRLNIPDEIWLDQRVAQSVPEEPDENKAAQGVEQVRYFSAQRVAQLVAARNPREFFINVAVDPNDGRVYALTNYGRLFYMPFAPERNEPLANWIEIEGPDLGQGGSDAAI